MKFDFRQMHVLEQVVFIIPFIVVGVAVAGLLMKRWSFTSSLFWRLACFLLPVTPMCMAVLTYGICKSIGYDNGRPEAFRPDSFACGCFFLATPFYIVVALILSVFATGVRILASALNICLGIVWYVILAHIRM